MVSPAWKRIGLVLLSAMLVVVGSFLFFSSITVPAAEETYLCVWQDGSVSEETYASAYPDFLGNEEGALRLLRGELYGEIQPSQSYLAAVQTLKTGELAELRALSMEGVSCLEQFALWRMTRGWVWYSSGYFVWKASAIEEVKEAEGERLILLSGSISAARLKATGATSIELRAASELNKYTLNGTFLENVTAYAPYYAEDGAIYLDTEAGVRLIAALASVTEFTAGEYDYADEGALLFAQSLRSVTLPFAGDARVWSNNFHGEVAYLFSNGREYLVPPSLRSVTITGGLLVSHAFYRMDAVEEITLCGMDEGSISADALVDCTALKLVHSPNANIKLTGKFTASSVPCGCTVFECIG